MKEIRIGLIGFGTVGKGLAQALLSQRERLIQRSDIAFTLTTVADIALDSLPEEFSDITLFLMFLQKIGFGLMFKVQDIIIL